jgi:hypothetical protein
MICYKHAVFITDAASAANILNMKRHSSLITGASYPGRHFFGDYLCPVCSKLTRSGEVALVRNHLPYYLISETID